MNEASKSAKRRFYDGNFITKYFCGAGIDIGCGSDCIWQWKRQFPLMQSVRAWDMQDGDAQYLVTEHNEKYDFVHASHNLEHLVDPRVALTNWSRVTKPGGYIIITVPDERLYENMTWESKWTNEHLWSFTICKKNSPMPKSINVVDLVNEFADILSCEKIQLIDDFYRPELSDSDQTLLPNCESAIEIIFKKL